MLAALQEKLLRQDLFEEFCDEFTREMNRLRMEHRASLCGGRSASSSASKRDIKKLIEAIKDGVRATPT